MKDVLSATKFEGSSLYVKYGPFFVLAAFLVVLVAGVFGYVPEGEFASKAYKVLLGAGGYFLGKLIERHK